MPRGLKRVVVAWLSSCVVVLLRFRGEVCFARDGTTDVVLTVRGAEPRPAGLGPDRNGFSWVLGGSTLAALGEEGVQGYLVGVYLCHLRFPFRTGGNIHVSRITRFWEWGIRSVFGNRKTESLNTAGRKSRGYAVRRTLSKISKSNCRTQNSSGVFFFFFSLLLQVLPFFMHGAYAPELGNPADWRWKRAALRVFPYRAVGKRKGPDFIWGGGRRTNGKDTKLPLELEMNWYVHVCMQEFTGGGTSTPSAVGVSLRNTTRGVFILRVVDGGVRKGEIWGRVFLERNFFFFFFSEQLIHHKWESRSSVMVTVVKCEGSLAEICPCFPESRELSFPSLPCFGWCRSFPLSSLGSFPRRPVQANHPTRSGIAGWSLLAGWLAQ